MLHVCCIRAGTAYGPEYVEILFDMVRRNLSEGYAGEFTCFTDQLDKLSDGITVRPLPTDLPGWWSKLGLFRAELFPDGDRVVFLDLDTVIIGRLDEILAYDGAFATLRDFYRPNGLQSSVMLWEAGTNTEIWETYEAARCPMIDPGGDQMWIEHTHRDKAVRLQDIFPGLFVSYKLSHGIPADASMVIFHGRPRPHECDDWVKDVWKIGGLSRAQLDVVCNTAMEKLFANVRSSSARDLPWFDFPEDGTLSGHVVLVGGGPSLAETIEEIKWRKGIGQQVWALNGSARFLKEHGIIPDALLMCDARPQNIDFVTDTDESTTYFLASQCDPKVFDYLLEWERYVVLWHPNTPGIEEIVGGYKDKPIHLIGGGTTVGINALVLAFLTGYRKIHLFGYDSCYRDSEHHAYAQSLNDGERILDVVCGNRKFKCAPWMSGQATEFVEVWEQLTEQGAIVTAHGDGLIQHICHELQRHSPMSAPEQRAMEIVRRLQNVDKPFGVEIGVFTGRMSAAMLRFHNGLRLAMVDSWEGEGKAYEGDSGDWHADLSQVAQDAHYEQAKRATSFASERRRIVRERSLKASERKALDCMDFVFIDADHSYEGVKADLAAWWPNVKPGGWLSGHDYENPDFPKFGVTRAVDEFAAATGAAIERGENYTWFIRKAA